jgi:hypothetical protein
MNKKCVVIINVAIMSYNGLCSQDPEIPKTIWQKTFGGSEADYGNCIGETSDGGYVVIGSTWSFGGEGSLPKENAYIVKISISGDQEWEKVYEFSETSVAYSGQQTSDGGYVAAGSYGRAGSDQKSLLFKTNSMGDRLWERYIGEDSIFEYESNSIVDIHELSDGDLIMAGSYSEATHDVILATLRKTDKNGELRWEKTYKGFAGELEGAGANSMHVCEDGGFILTGFTSPPWFKDIYLLKVGFDGEIEWERKYSKGNGFAVTQLGQTYYISGGDYDGMSVLMAVDINGDEIWERHFDGPRAGSIQNTAIGGLFVGGTKMIMETAKLNNVMMKFDSDGAIKWKKAFCGKDASVRAFALITSTGDYVMTGTAGGDLFVAKLDHLSTEKGLSAGDVNGDGGFDISDPVSLLNYLFIGEYTPDCVLLYDFNGDRSVDISDPVSMLSILFLGGPKEGTSWCCN